MKCISWNVNWIRSIIQKWFIEYLNKENPDIIWLQEIKAEEKDVPIWFDLNSLGYYSFWNSSKIKKWYSGTAIFTKIKPIKFIYDTWIDSHDKEWRIITLEFDKFYFVNVYTPNAKRDLERLDYRQLWDSLFFDLLKRLETDKPVIVCWDFNVAHKEIDLYYPWQNKWNAWFTDEEREGFSKFLNNWFIDTYRHLYPNKIGAYSWWSNFSNSRSKNIWWRIDYFLISNILWKNLKNSFIHSNVFWSDHCPVWIEINL